jgi:hypothetical protein
VVVLAAAGLACGGSNDGSGATGCSGLSACCGTLSGAEAETCQAAIMMDGITDAQCTQALQGFQSSGLCSGGGSSDSGGGGGHDAGAGADTSVSSAAGCAALSACCPDLPVSEDPMGCLTVAKEGTSEACTESLASYNADGYCLPDAGPSPVLDASVDPDGVKCYELMGTGASLVCASIDSTTTGFTCAALGTLDTGSCPSAGLFGCCITVQAMSGTKLTTAACYYSATTGVDAKSACSGSGKLWSSTAP